MSLLNELTADLRAASEHLPLATIRGAVAGMRTANDRLIQAIRLGAAAHASLARLGAATTHLEAGAGLMMRAQDEVSAYLAAIGAGAFTVVSSSVASAGRREPDWWALRVGVLTGESGSGRDDPATTSTQLLNRVIASVRSNDRAALHRELVAAGPGLGSSIGGRTTAALRELATAMCGREPTIDEARALRSRAGSIHDLLPNLPSGVLTTVAQRACGGIGEGGHDPVDLAVATTVFAARLGLALGRERLLLDDVHAEAASDRSQPAKPQRVLHG